MALEVSELGNRTRVVVLDIADATDVQNVGIATIEDHGFIRGISTLPNDGE